MCLEIYVHCTTPEHDTRRQSIINPITGYTVYSPWQEPDSKICDYPHIAEQIDMNQYCPWHPGCCRLERHHWCWSDNCSIWTKYHHFVDEENGETKDISFLNIYRGHNPTHLYIAGWLFKAGAELWFSYHHLINLPISIEGSSSYAAGLANAEWLRTRLHEIAIKAKDCLAQFAILYDLNSGPGALPPRPGAEADPRRNEYVSKFLGLRVADSRWSLDTSTVSWPHNTPLWDKFCAGILPMDDDPYVVPWIAGASRVGSDPDAVFSTALNLNGALLPKQNPPEMIYNPGMPYIYPMSPSHVVPPEKQLEALLDDNPTDTFFTPPSTPTPSTPTPSTSTLLKPTFPTNTLPMDTLLSPYSPKRPTTTPVSPPTTPTPEANISTSPIPDSAEVEVELDEEDNVHDVEALVGHHPPHAARPAVKWYKVRWEGDWENDKETWERVADISTQLVDAYWEKLNAETPRYNLRSRKSS
ncbi:hypothetical protein F5Y00DRAFT_267164 [Daldinia vernicosa]|uniref:uncharacterized protein n=1 Tax=Daldinia vernicosa TaxID=114800 RepID=UPI0020077E04|nr:uncharacterized protein F5Y00DRAFT_267164 [Daldinia vernicosa]KAI0843847.1 hypothetical protein F5Y00DRAFT_267164 [Daldinia vernicosa]